MQLPGHGAVVEWFAGCARLKAGAGKRYRGFESRSRHTDCRLCSRFLALKPHRLRSKRAETSNFDALVWIACQEGYQWSHLSKCYWRSIRDF